MPEPLDCDMRSAAKFELRVTPGNTAPFTGIFGATSVGVVRCVRSSDVCSYPSACACSAEPGARGTSACSRVMAPTGCSRLVVHASSCGHWSIASAFHAQQPHPALLMHRCADTGPTLQVSSRHLCLHRFSLGRMAHPPYAPAAALKFLIDGQKVCFCGARAAQYAVLPASASPGAQARGLYQGGCLTSVCLPCRASTSCVNTPHPLHCQTHPTPLQLPCGFGCIDEAHALRTCSWSMAIAATVNLCAEDMRMRMGTLACQWHHRCASIMAMARAKTSTTSATRSPTSFRRLRSPFSRV